MTLVSSGQIALQDAGSNPSSTATNELFSRTLYAGNDSTVNLKRRYEINTGDQFLNVTQWSGSFTGYATASSSSGAAFVYNHSNSFYGIFADLDVVPVPNYQNFGGGCFINSGPTSTIGTWAGLNTFNDGGGTSRAISAAMWSVPNSSCPSENDDKHWFLFALNGSSISNSDTTFKEIKVSPPGTSTEYTFTRSAATRYDSNDNGDTVWIWVFESTGTTTPDNLGTNTGGHTIKINGADIVTTFNNGIAEEMGGDDSADVKISDYYSGGTFTGTISGIPTSGEIQFSDFYGKSFVSSAIHAFTFTPAYVVQQIYTNVYSYSSGYSTIYSNSGSISDASFPNSGTINFGGSNRSANSVTVTTFRNYAINNATNGTAQQLILSSSSAFTNAGFSTVKVWLNSTSASGSPDLTLNRTDASFYNFGSGPYTGQWTWSNTLAYSTYFGNSLSNGTHYVEIN